MLAISRAINAIVSHYDPQARTESASRAEFLDGFFYFSVWDRDCLSFNRDNALVRLCLESDSSTCIPAHFLRDSTFKCSQCLRIAQRRPLLNSIIKINSHILKTRETRPAIKKKIRYSASGKFFIKFALANQ